MRLAEYLALNLKSESFLFWMSYLKNISNGEGFEMYNWSKHVIQTSKIKLDAWYLSKSWK